VTRTVAFILCPGHSGSTLLGHFLGAHPRILHVGEIPTPIRRNRPFVCRVCEGASCPVWGTALDEDLVRSCVRRHHRERRWPRPVAAAARRLLGLPDARMRIYRRLFKRLPEIEVVVDGSKIPRWARWNMEGGAGLRGVVLHLTRDLRGVLASHRHRLEPEPTAAICHSLVRSTRALLAFTASLPTGDVARVRYEDLVRRPAATGEALCRLLGLDWEPGMLEYYARDQHVIGGNPGPTYEVRRHQRRRAPGLEFLDQTSEANQRFYRERQPGFVEDLRWKQELSAADLECFERIAAPLNRELGYPGPD
jgi:hypothetical protein